MIGGQMFDEILGGLALGRAEPDAVRQVAGRGGAREPAIDPAKA